MSERERGCDYGGVEGVSDDIKISGEEYVLFICNGNR